MKLTAIDCVTASHCVQESAVRAAVSSCKFFNSEFHLDYLSDLKAYVYTYGPTFVSLLIHTGVKHKQTGKQFKHGKHT